MNQRQLSHLWVLALAVTTLAFASASHAVTISLLPVTQPAAAQIEVDVVVGDLSAGGAPSLGAFDIDVLFDPAVLSLSTVGFGNELGNPLLLEAFVDANLAGSTVSLAEVSLLAPAELDTRQGDSVTVATLRFDMLSLTGTTIDVGGALLSDAFGGQLDVTATSSARVEAIPEPTALVAFAAGLGALGLYTRRGRSRRTRTLHATRPVSAQSD